MPKLTLAKLLERVRRLTAERGKPAALAKALGVHRARVSGWLSGEVKPDGEAALELLAWVQAEESKQQTPGSVITTAKGKQTRSRNSRETKPKSGPSRPK